MALLGDRVQETTTTTGTGTFALNGAVTGYVTFNSTFSNGDIVWYVADDGAGNWEIGYGTVGTGTLTRTVFQSSNSNNLVVFAAGAKRLFCSAPYTYFLPDQTGQDGKILTTASGVPSWTTLASAGAVTSISVATANGLAGTSSGGATPALTLSTTITGVLKGNGTAISAAVAGTDYAGLASANTFTNNQVISVSSASDALRITQTGAGNALVVEDSANPDSTPFVVDANGRVLVGIQTSDATTYTANTAFQISSNTQTNSTASLICWNATQSNSANIQFNKSASGTIGTRGVVASGDSLGTLLFSGDDGTSFIRAASIQAAVDGTPGTNDMPGRLVFSTTADGASSPTERMRIDSRGNVGIGGTNAAVTLGSFKNITGGTTAAGVANWATLQSDVTSIGYGFSTFIGTQAAAFTNTSLNHFHASQATIGAGSSITNQYGFRAESSLTGATNNFGFYSNIASGSGRYNFYASGTADNYFAGVVISGNYAEVTTNSAAGTGLRIKTPSGSGSAGILQFTNNPVTAQWAAITSPAANVLTFNDGGNVEKFRLDSSGNLVVTGTGGLGYGTGSGGAVTQITSRTTGVTLNKTNGAITLVSAAGSTTWQSFTVTNSTVAATDVIQVSQKSGTDLYEIHVTAVAAGSFRISFKTTGGTTTEQPVFNFAVLKAVVA